MFLRKGGHIYVVGGVIVGIGVDGYGGADGGFGDGLEIDTAVDMGFIEIGIAVFADGVDEGLALDDEAVFDGGDLGGDGVILIDELHDIGTVFEFGAEEHDADDEENTAEKFEEDGDDGDDRGVTEREAAAAEGEAEDGRDGADDDEGAQAETGFVHGG